MFPFEFILATFVLLLVTVLSPAGVPVTFITGAVSPIVTLFLSNDIVTSFCCFGDIVNVPIVVSSNGKYFVPASNDTFTVYFPAAIGLVVELPSSA